MDTDIALARLASGRAVPIGAECGCGVHDGPPGFVWKQAKRSMLGPPFSLQVSFTTVKCRATWRHGPRQYWRFLGPSCQSEHVAYGALVKCLQPLCPMAVHAT